MKILLAEDNELNMEIARFLLEEKGAFVTEAKTIPIIAMTANAFAEDWTAALKVGMNEHIAKPLDTKKVVETIARLVTAYRKQK